MTTQKEAKRGANKLVRIAWLVGAALALGVFIISIPAYLIGISEGRFLAGPVENPSAIANLLNIAGGLASFLAASLSLGLAALIFLKRQDDRMALFVSFYLLGYGILMVGPLEILEVYQQGWSNIAMVMNIIILTAPSIAMLCIFPNSRFVPGWTRWLLVLSILLTPMLVIFTPGFWPQEGWSLVTWMAAAIWITIYCLAIYAAVYRYRNVSKSDERQQTKWILYGLVGMFVAISILTIPWGMRMSMPAEADVPLWMQATSTLWFMSMNILPLSLTVAVMRYRLWEIDIIIRRTLLYFSLTALLAIVFFGSVVVLQGLFHSITGQDSPVVIVISTLAIAALFNPLRLRLQDSIDRRFNRRKYDAEKALDTFAAAARDEVDIRRLTEQLVHLVGEAVQPTQVALWLTGAQEGENSQNILLTPAHWHEGEENKRES